MKKLLSVVCPSKVIPRKVSFLTTLHLWWEYCVLISLAGWKRQWWISQWEAVFKNSCIRFSFNQKALSSYPFFVSLRKIGSLLFYPNQKFHFFLVIFSLRLVQTLLELISIPRSFSLHGKALVSSSQIVPISLRSPIAHLEQSLLNINLIMIQNYFFCCALFHLRGSTLKIGLNTSKSGGSVAKGSQGETQKVGK